MNELGGWMKPEWPTRVVSREEARHRYGDLVDRLVPWLSRADPLADAAVHALHEARRGWSVLDAALSGADVDLPEALRALLDDASSVPVWVDWDRIRRAGRMFFRTGPLGGLVLGARSLVQGYASPAGNKPLILTGRLQSAGQHRLAETGRFVAAVCAPDGLRPRGRGWQITLRVRLMHAEVRRLANRSGRWSEDAWGAPINQHDMLATSLLFSQVWLDGVRTLGLGIDGDEGRDWLHLWRWCSVVLGVEPSLLPVEEEGARRLVDLILLTQDAPDADARRLVAALLGQGPPAPASRLPAAFCRTLLGDRMADALDVPRTRWSAVVAASRPVVARLDHLTRRWSVLETRRARWGRAYWEAVIAHGLEGRSETYRPPARLRSSAAS